jgi:hypothetical protein
MRMRLSPPELNYHNSGVYSLDHGEESWAVRRKALGNEFVMHELLLEFFRYAEGLWCGNQGMLSLILRVLRFQLLFCRHEDPLE